MNKLSIKLENCYGIGKLEQDFDFEESNSVLIYAPNGTMKSSFAETFSAIARGETPRDRIYSERSTTCDIFVDTQRIKSEAILIVNAEEDFDATDKISSFIASADLKKRYDAIYSELNESKNDLVTKLKKVSQSTDCEKELISTFSTSDNKDFFEILLPIVGRLVDKHEKIEFRYNDVFDKKGNVKKFLEKNQALLKQYFDCYQELISNSRFFKKSNNTFGTTQANEIIKSTEDNAFFQAGHKFVLDGDIDIDSVAKLKTLVEEEIKKIADDKTLKDAFDKVDKAVGANAELRDFKKVVEEKNLLLVELQNYEGFREKAWIGYLYELKEDVVALSKLYEDKKKDVEKILSEAKKEQEVWRNIIALFNSRFYVPFHVEIKNQDDIILKESVANLVFKYKERGKETFVPQEKGALLKILSKGEKRAYHILQLLFEIESRKQQNYCSLLIFDDIADSFDYKNKYAIIEYIKDLHKSDKFKSIILTHNFDFYRTVASRLGLNRKSAVLMSLKNENGEIKLAQGQYVNDVFDHFIKRITEQKVFVSLISFVRNIVEYTNGRYSEDYVTLTNCLHIKEKSNEISVENILDIYKLNFPHRATNMSVGFGNEKIISLISKTADAIVLEEDVNEILLENKIALSIAIRLQAEQYMIVSLPDFDTNTVTSNQTSSLFNAYKKAHPNSEKIRILDRVNLMTPENIHLNAFMYEPLIDMSVQHLIGLYKEVSSLNSPK